jgi:hypothetical protein
VGCFDANVVYTCKNGIIILVIGLRRCEPVEQYNQHHSQSIQHAICYSTAVKPLQVVRLGFDREHLVSSLRSHQQNNATVTYWLLLDNRRRMPSSGLQAAGKRC